jgi:hypothetical protein
VVEFNATTVDTTKMPATSTAAYHRHLEREATDQFIRSPLEPQSARPCGKTARERSDIAPKE